MRYLATKEFQQVAWWNYQTIKLLYNAPDEVKSIWETPVSLDQLMCLRRRGWDGSRSQRGGSEHL